jgi:lipopolysaccharide transport system permease protein
VLSVIFRHAIKPVCWARYGSFTTALYDLVYTGFSEVMKARMPDNTGPFAYSIYLCSGVLTWGLFTEMLDKGQSVFINNANLIKKLSFPKICLPIIVTLSAVLNFAIIFSLFLIFIIVTVTSLAGCFLGDTGSAFADPFGGLGMILGVMNVFFRIQGNWLGLHCNLVLVHSHCLRTEFITSMGEKSAAV